MAAASGLTLLAAGILAATAPADSVLLLTLALILLGIGCNFGLVSGTAIITNAVPLATRAKTQGLVDVANAVPVAEFTLAMILLSNKAVFRAERIYRERRAFFDPATELTDIGNHRRTVGIVGTSTIGRALIRLLRPFDLDVVAYSPEMTPALAAELRVRAAELDEVMAAGDAVSLHQRLTPETTGQIDARRLALMRDGATLLNTARGAVVDHEALLAELRSGRIRAVLDVTEPQPLPPGSPFFDLPNVVPTPHVAGSLGGELPGRRRCRSCRTRHGRCGR